MVVCRLTASRSLARVPMLRRTPRPRSAYEASNRAERNITKSRMPAQEPTCWAHKMPLPANKPQRYRLQLPVVRYPVLNMIFLQGTKSGINLFAVIADDNCAINDGHWCRQCPKLRKFIQGIGVGCHNDFLRKKLLRSVAEHSAGLRENNGVLHAAQDNARRRIIR